MKHEKLVRDKIPIIIERDGRNPVVKELEGEDFHQALIDKFLEEVSEYNESHDLSELADILEVIHGVLAYRNVNFEELEIIRKEKENSRGGFYNGLFLIRVDD